MIRITTYVLLWILLMGTAIFAGQNLQLVSVKLLVFASVGVPLGLVLVACAGLGGIVVTLFQVGARRDRQEAIPLPRDRQTETSAAREPTPANRENDWDDW